MMPEKKSDIDSESTALEIGSARLFLGDCIAGMKSLSDSRPSIRSFDFRRVEIRQRPWLGRNGWAMEVG